MGAVRGSSALYSFVFPKSLNFKIIIHFQSNDIIKKNNILKQKQKDLLILENNRKHLKEKIQDVENDLKGIFLYIPYNQ